MQNRMKTNVYEMLCIRTCTNSFQSQKIIELSFQQYIFIIDTLLKLMEYINVIINLLHVIKN